MSQGQGGGRPLKFTDPDDLERRINEYFDHCDNGRITQTVTKRGDLVEHRKRIPYTMEGLAVWLDCSGETIRNYGKSGKFFETISRARDRIHQNWIENGMAEGYNAKIVNLCLAASCKDYHLNQDNTLTVMTIEDRLRQIHQERRRALPDPDTTDAEVIE